MGSHSKHISDIDFNCLNRKSNLDHASKKLYDLIVIGGGITGAGIAMDATLRGLKTLLIEKNDFASGTSSKSTKLIHGGLRYLKQFEFGLVRESGLERRVAHNNIPHLVHPEKMLLPIVKGGSFSRLTAAMAIGVYDVLANVESEDRKQTMNRAEVKAHEPLLKESTLKSGILYSEYRTDDARLTIELIKHAKRHGAEVFNYCELTEFNYKDGLIRGINARDHFSDIDVTFSGRHVVSAAGPWVDSVRMKEDATKNKALFLTKGVHIVIPHTRLPIKSAVYFDAIDGRMVFAIPRGRVTYIGTTDTPYDGNLDKIVCTKQDASYLLDCVNNAFNIERLTIEDIESTWAGLRPLISEAGKSPSELSRKDEVFISDSGLISIAGGKLTGYRKMAKRVVDLLCEKEKNLECAPCLTESQAIHVNSYTDYDAFEKDVSKTVRQYESTLSEHRIKHLLSTYGLNGHLILENALAVKNSNIEEALLLSELDYCLTYESAVFPIDFINRRSSRLYFDVYSIHQHLDLIIDKFCNFYKWDASRKQKIHKQTIALIKDATVIN
ncbi:MAG: glycerol-3-phosphate dehydrogenase/oxidase [Saprospiraceae bacterium]|nr:glycerol-3-phosphate dehydrogenase/oxidase [Saprospiraceae bacterium]